MGSLKKMEEKLIARKAANAFRAVTNSNTGIDFCSNDYLGVATLPFQSTGKHGSTGSRLLSGNYTEVEALEQFCATFFNQPAGLIFNSGYTANLGFFATVPSREDNIIYDALCHASIRDGIKLGNARSFNFRHNDIRHLEQRLKQFESESGSCYVVVESVYSMDGDTAPLKEIAELCSKYNANLVVDEAHGGGVFGKYGEGLVSDLGLDSLVFAKIITFGKAFGSHGAVVLGTEILKNYLINFCRAFIYTTALPPNNAQHIHFAIKNVERLKERRELLHHNITYFQKKAKEMNVNILPSLSPIQIILIPGNEEVKQKAKQLAEAGMNVKAILSPTVEKGKERMRICLHSFNTTAQIDKLLKHLL